MHYSKLFVYIALIVMLACSTKAEDLSIALQKAETIDDAIAIARRCEKLGAKSLPIFIKTLKVLIREELVLDNYGKISICLDSLDRLANRGICSRDEAIFLLEFIQKQTSITDTLITARILTSITGTNVGYDKDFVEHYTAKEEYKRQQMILKWKQAIETKWAL